MLLYALVLLAALGGAEEPYNTKVEGDPINLRERVGETLPVQLPVALEHITNIDIPEAVSSDNEMPSMQVCSVQEPGIRIKEESFYFFREWKMARDVVTDFEDLMRQQTILDMTVFNELIYVCLGLGRIKVFTIMHLEHELIKTVIDISMPGVTTDNPLTDGCFVTANGSLLFLSGRAAFRVDRNNLHARVLSGYVRTDNFEAAEWMPEFGLLAVAMGTDGLAIYEVDTAELSYKGTLGSLVFESSIDISDIVAYGKRLYVLNRLSGVVQLALDRSQPQQSKVKGVLLNKTNCENIVEDSDTIYVSCPDIIQVEIESRQTQTFPNSLFRIKNLVVQGDLVVAVGQNLIKVYSKSNLVGFYQQFEIDRLRLVKEKMYIASEAGLAYASWSLVEAQITCGMKSLGNELVEGTMSTLITVEADCDREYFGKLGLQFADDLHGRKCLYHFPLNIDFWQGSHIETFPAKIVSLLIILTVLLFAIAYFFISRQISAIHLAIDKYSHAKKKKDKGYADLVEDKEAVTGGRSITEKEMKVMSEDRHEIGD